MNIISNAIYQTRNKCKIMEGITDEEFMDAVGFARNMNPVIKMSDENKWAFATASVFDYEHITAMRGNRKKRFDLFEAICTFEIYRLQEIREQNTLRSNNSKLNSLEESCFFGADEEAS